MAGRREELMICDGCEKVKGKKIGKLKIKKIIKKIIKKSNVVNLKKNFFSKKYQP